MIINIILGYVIGFISGIAPSFHINNTALLMYSLYIKYHLNPYYVLLFSSTSFIIGSMLSVMFYKVPSDEDTIYVPYIMRYIQRKGIRNYYALSLLSMSVSLVYIALFLPLISIIIPRIYSLSISLLPYLLGLVILFFLLKNGSLKYLFIMVLAAILGYITLYKLNMNENFTLLPLFVGFYGIPNIFISLKTNNTKDTIYEHKRSKRDILKINHLLIYSFAGFLSSCISILIPAVPPILFLSFIPLNKKYSKGNIISLSSLSFSDSIMSIISQKIINNSRSGVGVVLSNIKPITYKDISYLLIISALFLLFSFYVVETLFFNERVVNFMQNRKTKLFVVLFILLLTYFTTSWIGISILILSSLIGYLTLKMKLSPVVLLFSIIIPLWISLLF